jgi:hypothetical protein
VLPVLRHLDAIETGTRKGDLAVRRVDARGFAQLQHAHAEDDLALCDIQREIGIVQPRKMQAGVGREAELPEAEVDFGAAVIAHPNIVAARHRVVNADGDPLLRCILRRQEQFAADVGDTTDARSQVVIRARRRRQHAGKREQREQAGDDAARDRAVQHHALRSLRLKARRHVCKNAWKVEDVDRSPEAGRPDLR